MTHDINRLVPDIYKVLQGNGQWTPKYQDRFAERMLEVAKTRIGVEQKPRNYISMSSLGESCPRKMWLKVNQPTTEVPSGESIGTFLYGDMLEQLVITLAEASGHSVEGLQTTMEIDGIPGSRDAVIDGMTVDIKSASDYNFTKFASGRLRERDDYGYISQLSSYVAAGAEDPLVTNKTHGAFLVVQKTRFKLCLDIHDFSEEIRQKPQEIARSKALVSGSLPSEKVPDEPEGKSGNRVLSKKCGWCEYRKNCWPHTRKFMYSTGIKEFTKVLKEPKVDEWLD